jgi:ribonuclease P protein component
MLPAENRLRTGYLKIYKDKKRVSNKYFLLFYKENNLSFSRFGFVIRKKLGKAFFRNKVKRRFRFAIRTEIDKIKPGFDFIFLINHNFQDWENVSYLEIKKNIFETLKSIDKI